MLLKINGVEFSKFTEYEITYNKLWSSNTGRDLNGSMRGTLVGIFTKLKISVGQMDENSFKRLTDELNKPSLVVQYYDPNKKKVMQETMYSNDIGSKMLSAKRKTMSGFSFSLIANYKRSKAIEVQ